MQAKGRLYTSIGKFRLRQVVAITGTTLTLDSSASLLTDSQFKPFIIQNNKIAQVLSVISDTEVEIDNDPGFVTGDCYTPWSNIWKFRIGDKAPFINKGDIVVGPSGDAFQVIAVKTYGVNDAVLGLWQVGVNKEPTSAEVVIFTPTSDFHLLPKSDVDTDITNILSNNRLDNLSNKLLDDSVREDIWAKPTNYTRDLLIDISAGWYGQLQINERTGIVVSDDSVNYVEIDEYGNVIVNTVGWNPPNLKVAEVVTDHGIITNITQVWVKNSTQVIPEGEQAVVEGWKVNIPPLETPDGIIDTFTIPNGDIYLAGKVKVTINGLEDYCFSEINNGTQIRFDGTPLPQQGDVVTIDYAVPIEAQI